MISLFQLSSGQWFHMKSLFQFKFRSMISLSSVQVKITVSVQFRSMISYENLTCRQHHQQPAAVNWPRRTVPNSSKSSVSGSVDHQIPPDFGTGAHGTREIDSFRTISCGFGFKFHTRSIPPGFFITGHVYHLPVWSIPPPIPPPIHPRTSQN